jgi:predicted nucleic acid-binding protein
MVDLLLAREPWFGQAKAMWDARDAQLLECAVPASTLTDLYYICQKPDLLGPAGAKRAIEMIIDRFEIIPVDRATLVSALGLQGPDFEDNVQTACAIIAKVDMIITRNRADFRTSPVLVIEPAEVISHLSVS